MYVPLYPPRKCSRRAAEFVTTEVDQFGVRSAEDIHASTKYPFEMLELGECFVVPYDHVKPSTIRVAASRAHYGKRFRVLQHDDKLVYEIVRVR